MQKLFLVLLLFIAVSTTISAQRLTHVLGEVIIQVEADKNIHELIRELGITHQSRSFAKKQISKEPLNLWLVSMDPNELNELKVLDEINGSKSVQMAQFNHLIKYRKTPNDPEFGNQWQYINPTGADIDMEKAWDTTTGGLTASGDTIVVCVIDDGIKQDHEDFVGNMWINRGEIPNNGIDDDLNNRIDDYLGWDPGKETDVDIFGNGNHGTPVAGIVGATGNNGIGVAGVNWNVKLMIVRGGGNEAQALAAYSYPYWFRKKYNETNGAEGAFVVATNASWGTDYGKAEDAPIWCDFYNKLGEIGILSCGATANASINVDVDGDLPTSCPSDFLISVTNMNKSDEKVSSAGYGLNSIDLGAFGSKTWTSKKNNTYGEFGGTSGATPHVTGTIALLYSIPCNEFASLVKTNPEHAARFIKNTIMTGVDYNESLQGITVTGGRLNVNNSMILAMDLCGERNFPTIVDVINISFDSGDIKWTVPDNSNTTNLRWKLEGTTNWTVVNNVSSTYTLDNLMSCSTYEFQLQSVYPGNILSDYSYSHKFLTKGCCNAPSNLSFEYTNDPSIVKISWDSYEQAVSQILEYKKDSESSWSTIQTTDNQQTISNITICSAYLCRLKSECEQNSSVYSDTLYFSSECGVCTMPGYCNVNGNNSDEWIAKVELHNISNESGAETDGYGPYLGAYSTILRMGESYPIQLTPGFSSGSTFSEYFKVWIDYNMNQLFEEDELAFDAGEPSETTVDGMITIPNGLTEGSTRMRVMMRYNEAPINCTNPKFGEVEDYCVDIKKELSIDTPNSNYSNVILFPSPFNDQFELTILNAIGGLDTKVELFDQKGQLLKSNISKSNAGDNTIKFDNVKDLPSGLLIINLTIGKKSESFKIVKL